MDRGAEPAGRSFGAGEVPWLDYRIQFADVFAAGGFDLVMCRVASNMPAHSSLPAILWANLLVGMLGR